MLKPETKRAIGFVVGLGNQAGTSFADGFQPKDFIDFLDEAMQGPQFGKDLKVAAAQFKNKEVTDEDRKELIDDVKSQFDIPNDRAERKVEATVELILAVEKYWEIMIDQTAA